MERIENYMLQPELRWKLNDLTRQTFGFSFENWVTEGYFEGDYIPVSWLDGEKIVSNISVNRMEFLQNGEKRSYVQLGTVMTAPERRREGLAASLMHYVLEKWEPDCDGIYLFGNLSALGFYEKMGFRTIDQTRYVLRPELLRQNGPAAFRPVTQTQRANYLDAVRNAVPYAALEQLNRFGLQLFYTAGLDNVFHDPELDCYVVLEREGRDLLLQSIACRRKIPLQTILSRLGQDFDHLLLEFTPQAEDAPLFDSRQYDGGDDYRLFYRGEALEQIEQQHLYFPALSHA